MAMFLKNVILLLLFPSVIGCPTQDNTIILESNLNPDKGFFLSKEHVWEYINSIDIQHPDLVYAQVILESGHLKSYKCVNDCNLLGMKRPRRRPTTQIGTKDFSVYESWQSSIDDYKLWQDYTTRNCKVSRKKYLIILDKIYCKNGSYSNKLRVILSNSSIKARFNNRNTKRKDCDNDIAK